MLPPVSEPNGGARWRCGSLIGFASASVAMTGACHHLQFMPLRQAPRVSTTRTDIWNVCFTTRLPESETRSRRSRLSASAPCGADKRSAVRSPLTQMRSAGSGASRIHPCHPRRRPRAAQSLRRVVSMRRLPAYTCARHLPLSPLLAEWNHVASSLSTRSIISATALTRAIHPMSRVSSRRKQNRFPGIEASTTRRDPRSTPTLTDAVLIEHRLVSR